MSLISRAQGVLQGWPDGLLTLTMFLAAGVIVLGALFLSPLAKAALLAWVVMP